MIKDVISELLPSEGERASPCLLPDLQQNSPRRFSGCPLQRESVHLQLASVSSPAVNRFVRV
jgi:hypothetical protein